jgi:uncharacterized protein (DUF2236 family)
MSLSQSQEAPIAGGPVPLGPDSLVWKMGFPRTGLLVAGRALMLQTAHPVVGAGVRDFSDFTRDPWGRLDRTLRSLQVQLFGGPAALGEAQRLRRLHRRIRGTGFAGEHYEALDPEAYAWVHLSNFDTVLAGARWFGPSLARGEREQLYAEWRQTGLVLGIRDDCMPSDLDACRAYVRHMVSGTLTDNETVRTLLSSLELNGVEAPPWPLFPAPLWHVLRPLGRSFLRDVTVGTLPAPLRERLGLPWNLADRGRLQAAVLLVRAATGPLPDRVLHYPMGVQARREARRACSTRAA